MREIKFRAWIPFDKKMTKDWELLTLLRNANRWGQETGKSEIIKEAVIPLQYTGLKDKNGKDKYLFLTYELIHNTPTGKLLQKKHGGDDLIGHSVIREYFDIRSGQGDNVEFTDFSSPKNFPAIIARAIKRGEFRGFGEPKGLLSAQAEKVYQETKAPAWKVYQETTAPAWKVYQETTAQALKVYQETKAQVFWDLFADPKNSAEAWR